MFHYNQKLHAHIDCQFWISLHGDKRRELFGQRKQDITKPDQNAG